ncbi:putative hydro-lyase [Sulfurospirillum arsenophilum]|uniref:putative hydro-lyase n=1 Tax=Sulfurospirillum arsenophilum TaxID=56698 RepID=UPI0005AB14D9|nr:putative hydro-lyase [Sulfurospirillum arsenophilum]
MYPKELRAKIAKGEFTRPTAGECPGYIQMNMVALPREYAKRFEAFAKENAKAIPVLEVIHEGHLSKVLAPGADILNEIPKYNILKEGVVVETVTDITPYYNPDLVFFLIGCSFSFETALIENGMPLRHVDQQKNVAMYRTNIALKSVEGFSGEMVVSMRPIKKEKVADACVVTSHYPRMHGSPIQVGYPEMIGINDVSKPDYGDAIEIKADEIPLFWPCGVTPQNVISSMKLPFAITHSPGHMFVTDKKDSEYYE